MLFSFAWCLERALWVLNFVNFLAAFAQKSCWKGRNTAVPKNRTDPIEKMPPLEADIPVVPVEVQDMESIKRRIIEEIKDLCLVMKKVMAEHLEGFREFELTKMCKPDWPPNETTEVNAKQEDVEKKGDEIKIRGEKEN